MTLLCSMLKTVCLSLSHSSTSNVLIQFFAVFGTKKSFEECGISKGFQIELTPTKPEVVQEILSKQVQKCFSEFCVHVL